MGTRCTQPGVDLLLLWLSVIRRPVPVLGLFGVGFFEGARGCVCV